MAGVTGSPERLTLRASRSKWLVLLAGCLLFVAIGGWAWHQGAAGLGLLAVGFFGACGVFAAGQVLLPGRLTLSERGMHVTQFGRPWGDFEWQHCKRFRSWSHGTSPAIVVFDYTGPSGRWHGRLARASGRLTGSSARLPDTFGLPAADLALLLRQHKARARAGPDSG